MRICGLLFMLTLSLAAQEKKPSEKKGTPPKLTVALSLVVEMGKKTKVVVRGSNFEGITEVRVHEPKSKGVLAGKPKKVGLPNNYPLDRVGDSEIEIELDVAKDAPGGTLSFSVIGPGGESNAAKVALADDTPRLAEKEPNDGFDKPQAIALPVVVDAKIDRERDVDVFQFSGKAGDTIHVEVQAAKLGSPADLMLTLLDSDRIILDSCDDFSGSTDPQLKVKLPRDGNYYLSVLESNDLGGSMFPYRLIVRKP
jgi:Bacterial pre-peptidase C-terminal domain